MVVITPKEFEFDFKQYRRNREELLGYTKEEIRIQECYLRSRLEISDLAKQYIRNEIEKSKAFLKTIEEFLNENKNNQGNVYEQLEKDKVKLNDLGDRFNSLQILPDIISVYFADEIKQFHETMALSLSNLMKEKSKDYAYVSIIYISMEIAGHVKMQTLISKAINLALRTFVKGDE